MSDWIFFSISLRRRLLLFDHILESFLLLLHSWFKFKLTISLVRDVEKAKRRVIHFFIVLAFLNRPRFFLNPSSCESNILPRQNIWFNRVSSKIEEFFESLPIKIQICLKKNIFENLQNRFTHDSNRENEHDPVFELMPAFRQGWLQNLPFFSRAVKGRRRNEKKPSRERVVFRRF